ncbi:MAG: hypothetical protein K0S26_3327 [Bacteroidota bacterium]|jgi:hypothetical protein|nr:hypothetical protein [Bacteroidota bacterium]
MIKKLMVLALLCFPFINIAQGPGYLGKKTSVMLGFDVSPNLSYGTNTSPIVISPQISFERALSTRFSALIALRYIFTNFDNSKEIPGVGSPTSSYDIQSLSGILSGKIYDKKFVAPWGKYWRFGAVVNMTSTKHDGYMYITKQINNHDTLLMNFGPYNQLHNSYDFEVGRGRTRIVNNIIIDYGFSLQLLALANSLSQPSQQLTEKNYIRETAISKIQGMNGFNLYLKFGYLF